MKKVKFLDPSTNELVEGRMIKDKHFTGGYKIEHGDSVYSIKLIKFYKVI